MNAPMLSLLALLALAARTVQLRCRFAGWAPLWRFTSGPFTVELRRRAEIARLGGDSMEFPQPREFRALSLRLAGIPLWSRVAIVSLPADSDGRIDHIPPTEFDPLFDRQFRLGWPQQRRGRIAVRAW
jgi:hypothetical protein